MVVQRRPLSRRRQPEAGATSQIAAVPEPPVASEFGSLRRRRSRRHRSLQKRSPRIVILLFTLLGCGSTNRAGSKGVASAQEIQAARQMLAENHRAYGLVGAGD